MGVCDSTARPVSKHISQQSIERLSHKPSDTSKLKAASHNHLISRAVNIIDAANEKIKTYQEKNKEYEIKNEELEREIELLRKNGKEIDSNSDQYRDQLDLQAATMIKWKERIESLSDEIENMNKERRETNNLYANKLITISDTLYKIHGDNTSNLKYNKQSRKIVIFTNKINHLFYYDEHGPKYIIVRDISTNNDLIEKQMNKYWFLVVGDKRSVLFATENKQIHERWVQFIKQSITLHTNTNQNNNNNTENTENKQQFGQQFGQSQSPINIISNIDEQHTKIMKINEFETNPLSFNYPSSISGCTILNNGHTVQININNSKCKLLINNKYYQLKQFHFHTPSEHTIDNQQYEMEMHLVHINQENKIAVLGFIFSTKQLYKKPKLELTKSRAHLILSSNTNNNHIDIDIDNDNEFEESDDLETDDEWEDEYKKSTLNVNMNKNTNKNKKNDFLKQFWNELPSEKTEKEILLSKPISFDYLFETSSNNFSKNVSTNEIDIDMEIFEYIGSLTTPPYTEGVQWLVSKTTHYISEKQLKKLSACWGNQNNARPVQDYCGRTVSLRSKSSLRVV